MGLADSDKKCTRLLNGSPNSDDDGSEVEEPRKHEPLLPWTAILVWVYVAVCSIAMLVGFAASDISPRFENPDQTELWHSKVAVLLIVSSFTTEMCFVASSATNAYFMGWTISSELQMNRLGDSLLTLMEYGTKLLTGLSIWLGDGGVMHTDILAIGGPRPVYLARFMQWALGVPTLMLITNRSFMKESSGFAVFARSAPCIMAAFLYCWASWLMEVTTSHPVRWTMFCMSFVGHFVTSMDQIKLALAHRHGPLFSWKLGMLSYQITSFSCYSCVFCAGRFGLISSVTEQVIYAYTDASVKVFQGALLAMIRNREDLIAIRHWWTTALSVSQDLEGLIKKARVPIFALSMDGKISEWNSTLEDLTGLTLSDVKGIKLLDIVDADCKESFEAACRNVIKSIDLDEGATKSTGCDDAVVASSAWASTFAEISIPVKRGPVKMRQLAMTLVPKSTTSGEASGIVGIGQDLSDIAQLKITQERKSALMAMLSHEIRSPLHGIMGLTAAILDTGKAKSSSRQLGMINGCASRLLDLVANIMDLAQSEKRKRDGKLAPRPTQPVNFAMIAEEVAMMTNMATDRLNKPLLRTSVRLVDTLSGSKVPMIKGDPQKCTQLLYNLVTNACKFTERGTITLQCRHNTEGNLLEIDVVDTGKGISKDGQAKIFRAFEQEEEQSGDARNFQGIGLGLAVCTEIAELHGGELKVKSELGQGSTFTASFPCPPELGVGTSEPMPSSKPQSDAGESKLLDTSEQIKPPVVKPAFDSHGFRLPLVLSVDDDEVNQEVVRGALQGVCDIFCAMCGKEALNYLENRRIEHKKMPDAILLDIQMPEMDGFEVCDEIRKRFEAAHSRLPIIMISAKTPVDEVAIQSFTMGTTDFVPKPFNTEVLRRKVNVMLKAKSEFDLGGATTTIAAQAHMRLKEAQQRLQQEQQRSTRLEELAKQSQQKAAEWQAKVTDGEAENAKLRNMIMELESSNASLKNDVQEARLTNVSNSAAASAAAARAAEEDRELRKSADSRLKVAERKAQEMSAMVERLTAKLKEDEFAVGFAVDKQPWTSMPSMAAIKALQSQTSALLADDIRNPSLELGVDEQLDPNVSLQQEMVGTMLKQINGARAVISALNARMDILNTMSRGCLEMLQMPVSSSSFAVICEASVDRDYDRHELLDSIHYDWLQTVAQILGGHIAMMEQLSTPLQDLTASMQSVDFDFGQLFDGNLTAYISKDVGLIGA